MGARNQELEATLVARAEGAEALDRAAQLRVLDDCLLRPAATLELVDRYFDTPDGTLASRRIALRIRQSDGDVLLTVKGGDEVVSTGGTRRLELERPWSEEALDRALAVVASAGIPIDEPSSAAVTPDASSTLGSLGLQVVQERATKRRVRLLTPTDSARVLAEVDLDAVRYSLPQGSARLFEIEIEAKDEAIKLGRFVDSLIRELPGVSPWPYSKLATGMAIQRALSEGREILDANGAVSPAGWAALEEDLAQSA